MKKILECCLINLLKKKVKQINICVKNFTFSIINLMIWVILYRTCWSLSQPPLYLIIDDHSCPNYLVFIQLTGLVRKFFHIDMLVFIFIHFDSLFSWYFCTCEIVSSLSLDALSPTFSWITKYVCVIGQCFFSFKNALR